MRDPDELQPAVQPRRSYRIQAWLPDEETDARLRNAWLAVGQREGYSSLGELLWRPALAEVEEWERRHNGGRPFDPPASPHPGAGRAPRAGWPHRPAAEAE